ncbi:hypothetical protein HTZ77_16365 [Nonomuraea sp. SMC257]|uniref:Uncharacterized protein n=1 Tax=Nonomuraea montanisoli TaxID=2741721 RepID=A0A7Y6I794_9ACTN|nr:hypothetical protein [Nonomuraea montanisoli]NUW32998.1 hypothetical protein [Nonomuraea montanisoli]
MSESPSHSANPRMERMQRVQTAIEKTRMATAKLWNPWETVVEKGVEINKIKAPAGGGQVPETIPPSRAFTDYGSLKLRLLAKSVDIDTPTAQNFADIALKLKDKYVEVGRTNYRTLDSANCTLFACCVLGMLADDSRLLGKGVKVELFNLVESTGASGHAYVVVGRADGDPQDVDSYGHDCFFIDVWYARQRRTEPGTRSVKAATPDDAAGFWDETFIKDLIKSEGLRKKGVTVNLVPKLLFTSDDLTTFGLSKY